jgi:hypothetical protein
MKDVYKVLNRKEADLGRVRKEVESLRLVAPLLSDESDKPRKKPYSGTKNKNFNTLIFIPT